jgi:hypothetical protein
MLDEMDQETAFDSMTKAELQAEARARGVTATGTKAALLRRLKDRSGDREGADGEAERAADEGEAGRGDRDDAEPRDRGEKGGPRNRGQAEDEDRAEPQAEAEDEDRAEPQAEAEGGDRAEPQAEAEGEDRAEPQAEDEDEREGGSRPEGRGEDEPSDRDKERSPDGGAPQESAEHAEGDVPETAGNGGDSLALPRLASMAAKALADLTGRTIDAVSGVRELDGGYQVTIEVLELSRVPSTTDVLATYEVDVSRDGDVTGYARAHRYYRNQITRE